MMLFGEKYGERVRMITFDPEYSRELCGGCHVPATGNIGLFRITGESAVAAGVRRIEAITGDAVERYIEEQKQLVDRIREALKNPKDLLHALSHLVDENKNLRSQLAVYQEKEIANLKQKLKAEALLRDGVNYVTGLLENLDEKDAKTLSFQLEKELSPAYILFGFISGGKPMLMLHLSRELVETKGMNAVGLIKKLAVHIEGGGGGQAFFATAGGKNPDGLTTALVEALQSL